jgi:hypothetical protein
MSVLNDGKENKNRENAFAYCFDKLLTDLLKAYRPIERYFEDNDRLIDFDDPYYFTRIQKKQKKLIPIFKENINILNFSINLLENRVIDKVKNIKNQNKKIEDLIFRYIYSSPPLSEEDLDPELFNLREKIIKGMVMLEGKIIDYNKYAEKEKSGKLITLENAHKYFIESVLKNVDNPEFWS